MIESTMIDPLLEAEVVAKIRTWVFEKIDKPGDVTEVVYPFRVFPVTYHFKRGKYAKIAYFP